MSEASFSGLEPLNIVGNATARVDAVERVTARPNTAVI